MKQFSKNTKALSTLALILLLLISAIIGGLLSYLWVMGYYLSRTEKIPEKNAAAIVNVFFQPQNASVYNVTILNPSFSPDYIEVEAIALSVKGEVLLYRPSLVLPSLPVNISRGESVNFVCRFEWRNFVNETVVISAFIKNGTGSNILAAVPYTELHIDKVDFNPVLGIDNFTVTVSNDRLSVAYLDITHIILDDGQGDKNLTGRIQPALPYTLHQNDSKTFTCNFNWSSIAPIGGYHNITVLAFQGYGAAKSVLVTKVTFNVQEINFDPADTTHFNVMVKNQVSTNDYLNVSKIEVIMANGTTKNVTPQLNSSTNGVPGNSTATFTCAWDWTNYRNKEAKVKVYMLQGIWPEFGQQKTPPEAMLSITEEPVFPDTQHFFVTVKNSEYPRSSKTALVKNITVSVEGGAEQLVQIVQPSSGPYNIGMGETTMFGCYWNWTSFLNKSVNIYIYSDEGFITFRATRTPADALNYHVYLTIPSTKFNATILTQFDVNVTNSASSDRNANITRITVLLANGTEINATCVSLPFLLGINSTVTFTCQWDWTSYSGKNLIIRVYTNEGLKAITKITTP